MYLLVELCMTVMMAVIMVVFTEDLYCIIRLRRGHQYEYIEHERVGKLVRSSFDTMIG